MSNIKALDNYLMQNGSQMTQYEKKNSINDLKIETKSGKQPHAPLILMTTEFDYPIMNIQNGIAHKYTE